MNQWCKNVNVQPSKAAVHSLQRTWMFATIAILVSLFLCDIALTVLAYFSPFLKYHLSPPSSRNLIHDPVLGIRMSPYYPGHDSRGYRNEGISDAYDMLAIGDSLTYGYAAPPAGSWPRHLETLVGRSVYNAAVGGYGPCEYEIILNELLGLNPKVVLVGLYIGNDISNAYKSVYIDGRCTHLQSSDPVVLAEIKRADEEATLEELANRYGMKPHHPNIGSGFSPRRYIRRYSSLYKLGRSVLFLATRRGFAFRESLDDSFEAASKRPFRIAFDATPQFRTVFRNPKLDALAVNIDDPRIREGLRITQSIIISISSTLKNNGMQFIVVLMHNKPYVLSEIIRTKAHTDISNEFFTLVARTEIMTQAMVQFLAANEISWVDTLSAMRAQYAQGVSPYHASDDHHPNSGGYQAIAESLVPFLKTTK